MVPHLRMFRVTANAAPTQRRQSPNGRMNVRTPWTGVVMKNDASIPCLWKYGPQGNPVTKPRGGMGHAPDPVEIWPTR